jgi:hypothetical protein
MLFLPVTSYRAARRLCPVGILGRCEGGWLAFPTVADYVAWRSRQ